MDCIGTEYCTDGSCSTAAQAFSVEFDWNAEAIDLAGDGLDPTRLALVYGGAAPEAASGPLAFATPDGSHAIIIEAAGTRIEARLAIFDGVYTGQCTAREAA
ncbi:hypothetical protein KUL25_09985 [Rhodobacteraceae bacterium N5(2021)]|uniref:Uncharacterized protein n=1 Tax=Gymnodinialimonas phycosphaerae TaxID=2841589 RepID=A0A975TYB2_9RHOB|nr:hypothetical protein [Gymnodinialimonas phycosphaerae]MBY4893093.1 hypothetical protein [Gymnodinialimonas phycosphaerae]